MDPDAVAKAFVEHYYSTFDANRAGLANLYQDGSMLTFEGQKIQGSQNIVAKLTSLPFQQCKHQITTVDCQPSGPAGGMLVFVSGNLQLAGEQHALKFSQTVEFDGNNLAVSYYFGMLKKWKGWFSLLYGIVSRLEHTYLDSKLESKGPYGRYLEQQPGDNRMNIPTATTTGPQSTFIISSLI
nr:nuclear transport factor 2 [Ipomoea batatas]